ncbi:MAG: transposase, partial [Wolbachia sp.]|nr:transposase [Wolbachia sp.]MDD9336819.1 transposase [Wolbachia sp.]
KAKMTRISYIYETLITVYHQKMVSSKKVFEGLVWLGKRAKGWFFGFKLHIVIKEGINSI